MFLWTYKSRWSRLPQSTLCIRHRSRWRRSFGMLQAHSANSTHLFRCTTEQHNATARFSLLFLNAFPALKKCFCQALLWRTWQKNQHFSSTIITTNAFLKRRLYLDCNPQMKFKKNAYEWHEQRPSTYSDHRLRKEFGYYYFLILGDIYTQQSVCGAAVKTWQLHSVI